MTAQNMILSRNIYIQTLGTLWKKYMLTFFIGDFIQLNYVNNNNNISVYSTFNEIPNYLNKIN